MSTNQLASEAMPVVIATPILIACLMLVLDRWLPRRVVETVAIGTTASIATCEVLMLVAASDRRTVDWVGGWQPVHGFSVGIALVGDQFGIGMAALSAILMVCALAYSWHYFESAQVHYPALMLLFLAGITGFTLSGDLFNMFVFFELMGVVAYALTGLKTEDGSALHGALNFGIVNSFGAYVSLMGIGVVYAVTGQVGLAQISRALSGHPPSPVVAIGFVLVIIGFLVKAAVVPFHFWLDDAHAVAPTPVCVMFSGVMVELGLYGVGRTYWIAFSGAIPAENVRRALLVLGVLTAVVGAIMCFLQRHLKRMLAYSTIAHIGLFLTAMALLTTPGLAGAAMYVLGHAFVKSALFLVVGLLLNRYGSVDELSLHGRLSGSKMLGWMFAIGGLALAGLPPFGTGLGKAMSEDALGAVHANWGYPLFIIISAVTGAAVLRAWGRIFFGLGDMPKGIEREGISGADEKPELSPRLSTIPWPMTASILALLAGGAAVGLWPGLATAVTRAAGQFTDRAGYLANAFGHAHPVATAIGGTGWTASGALLGLLSVLCALALAALALYAPRLPRVARALGRRTFPLLHAMRSAHSGHVGDYMAWLLVGVAGLAALVIPL